MEYLIKIAAVHEGAATDRQITLSGNPSDHVITESVLNLVRRLEEDLGKYVAEPNWRAGDVLLYEYPRSGKTRSRYTYVVEWPHPVRTGGSRPLDAVHLTKGWADHRVHLIASNGTIVNANNRCILGAECDQPVEED